MAPKVTVGIPFYNAEATLADAIRSVFAQTLTDWELVLVDDGSTDDSVEVARSVSDPRVRIVCDGRHLGLQARLNQIVALARADSVARMDADDLMQRDRLALQSAFLDRNPAVDVVGTGMYILDADGYPVAKRLASKSPTTALRVLVGRCFMHATVLGRTDWFRRNPYDQAYNRAEDFELWCRTFDQSRFATLPGCHYICMEHASFSMTKYALSSWFVTRVQWKHGVRHVGFLGCSVLSIRQLLKFLIYAAAAGLRVQSRLIARRSVRLLPSEVGLVSSEIAYIKSIRLPRRADAAVEERLRVR